MDVQTTAATGEFNYFLPFAKVEKNEDGSRTVQGYASTERVDLDGEIVALDAVKAALPAYWEWRNIRMMHQPVPIGVAKEAHIDDHGLFVKSKIVDPAAIKLIDEEVLKGYSVGGKKLAKSGNRITKIELVEISMVDRPANPDCRVDVIKMAKAVEAGAFDVAPDQGESEVGFLRKTLSFLLGTTDLTKGLPGHDGFSRPANLDKREFSDKQRQHAADTGAAMPGGGYPIENEQDLKNAVQAFGRAKDKEATKKHIIGRAKALGATHHLPADWEGSTKDKETKKAADWDEDLFGEAPTVLVEVGSSVPALLKAFTFEKGAEEVLSMPVIERIQKGMSTVGDLCYAFSSIRGAQRRLIMEGLVEKDGDDKALADKLGRIASELAAVISEKAGHEGSEALFLTDEDDLTFYGFNGNMGVLEMADNPTDLLKRASAKVKEHVGKAAAHLRKAGKANVEARKCFGKACKMLGEKMKKAADDGDKDMMKLLKSVHDAMGESQDHMEMAHGALGKAATGWVGQREEGAMTSGPGWDENTHHVEALDQSKLTEGEVPWYECDEPYAGKAAGHQPQPQNQGVDLSKYVSKTEAEALARAAKAEGALEALNKAPMNERRAVVFDPNASASLGTGDEAKANMAKMLEGVDVSADNAAGLIIGNMIRNRMGKSAVFDPNFRGMAGTKHN